MVLLYNSSSLVTLRFAHIQDSEEGPSMPAIGSGRAVNLIEYLCRAGEPVRDRNRRVLKAMVLELLSRCISFAEGDCADAS